MLVIAPGPTPQSIRTPQLSTYNNTADCIERGLQQDGHCTWGFVIYRCSYTNETAWAQLLESLRRYAHKTLAFYNGLDLLPHWQLTVIEDRANLDGASTSVVRSHFKTWASTAVISEQGPDKVAGLSQRYRYCVRVGGDVLDCVHVEDEEGDEDDHFVDLVWADWEPSIPHPREQPEEPIEGCTRPDVGWMRVSTREGLVEMYESLRDQNAWYIEYRRPYEVVCK